MKRDDYYLISLLQVHFLLKVLEEDENFIGLWPGGHRVSVFVIYYCMKTQKVQFSSKYIFEEHRRKSLEFNKYSWYLEDLAVMNKDKFSHIKLNHNGKINNIEILVKNKWIKKYDKMALCTSIFAHPPGI